MVKQIKSQSSSTPSNFKLSNYQISTQKQKDEAHVIQTATQKLKKREKSERELLKQIKKKQLLSSKVS